MQELLNAVNSGSIFDLTPEQTAQYEKLMTDYGGVDGLEAKINDLNAKAAEIDRVAIDIATYQKAAILITGTNVTQAEIFTQTNQTNATYLTKVAQINASTVFTDAQKAQILSQEKTAYNQAITAMCSKIPKNITTTTNPGGFAPPIVTTTPNPDYAACLAKLIP